MKRCLTGKKINNSAAIEMAPLIDMVFLLLVFYIVSASFEQENTVAVNRPQSSNAAAMPGAHLSIVITKSGDIYVGGQIVETKNDRSRQTAIARELKAHSTARVLIHADRAVPTGLLIEIMDAARAAGAESVDVAAVKNL